MTFIVTACASPATTALPTLAPTPTSSPTAVPTSSPAPGPSFTVRSSETADGVTVLDVSFDGGRPTDAYLVQPESAAAGSAAGILWFHWLETGAPTSNRSEFLDEARELAGSGVVSVLVDGTFPWREAPDSTEHDRQAIKDELTMLRAAYELLLSQPAVDSTRTALVGHDFGAMYSSVMVAADQRPKALAMMAPTARWADWFYRYWLISDEEAAYKAALEPFDPVTALTQAGGRPVLLQFAALDQFVPEDVADEIAAAAGAGAERLTYDAGHELDEAAMADRDAWLAEQLQLPS